MAEGSVMQYGGIALGSRGGVVSGVALLDDILRSTARGSMLRAHACMQKQLHVQRRASCLQPAAHARCKRRRRQQHALRCCSGAACNSRRRHLLLHRHTRQQRPTTELWQPQAVACRPELAPAAGRQGGGHQDRG
jgi:hypothetical protein